MTRTPAAASELIYTFIIPGNECRVFGIFIRVELVLIRGFTICWISLPVDLLVGIRRFLTRLILRLFVLLV